MKEPTKKICFYSVATHLGGAERSLLDLVTRLERSSNGRYTPWLLLARAEGALLDAAREAGVDCRIVAMPGLLLEMSRQYAVFHPFRFAVSSVRVIPDLLRYVNEIEQILRENPSWIIHTTGIKCHALSVFLSRRTGVRAIWHLRDILSHGASYWLLRALRKWANIPWLANSQATADAFLHSDKGAGIVHNGLDPVVWQRKLSLQEREAFREKMGVKADESLVGIVGVLARWKGQQEFLGMAKRLVEAGVRARFAVIGGEIYDTAGDRGYGLLLREEARRLGIADRVFFSGHVNESGRYLECFDVAVHASLKPEPFGRVIIEAMALETPIVAAAGGGVLEIVEDRKTALLYPPGDVASMARSVQFLLRDHEFTGKQVLLARQVFLERFTVDRYVDSVVRFYDQLS